MQSKKLLLLLFCYAATTGCKDSIKSDLVNVTNPSNLKYISIADAREGKAVITTAPTVQTGGLLPNFELISIQKSDGTLLDESYLQYVTIGKSIEAESPVKGTNSANNGVISVAAGHNFGVGDYYFNIKVTTTTEGQTYSTVFEKAFQLHIAPLLPTNMVYSPKNQNLVYGNASSKTTAPLLPGSNPDVSFELGNYSDKLTIVKETGVIAIAPNYIYRTRETLNPVIKVISNISKEVVSFENKITVVITDKPEIMPVETIYFFYPTLKTAVALPTGGEGYTVQTDNIGLATRIWGVRANSTGSFFLKPEERPEVNTAQTILETQTHNASNQTEPTNTWMVMPTQDLTPFQYGYKLSFNYYYQPAFQTYMADGRTPTDLEVYISTDYTGGDIQDTSGKWLNGTWTKVNTSIKCQKSLGVNGSNSTGAPWGAEFIGTPYPGDQAGANPDNKKRPALGTFYNKWVKCTYDISAPQISSKFTVAFKVASYFEGRLLNTTAVPGRGGIYFLSDFNFKAVE
ncbi:hypothetical protein [Pedobacter heparinus]|uniref:Uncharacterized protein n=1 Tax=Pedobacter heparinus (strain ATCC 13125 / DSM 2366 / CIP 104194 / JCM 7457 / NBRC 12017 / NCIMB 9290 / NRRL B-14731 / HIM 762-3) TaxID=485917 RepID=C6Y0E0_PEDHD|nr:hypothetical protein [Pedobacter heparinus]ACU04852.1 hypothetical protein Phep_2651 [Pedobacter heparinus DSM 2366]